MAEGPDAFFLPVGGGRPGRRFCLYHPAMQSRVRGTVVYVHPLGEEMNKSRRMAAMQSRALANLGFSVLQIDLRGCGDNDEDFREASWRDWVEDVLLAIRWLQCRHDAPLWLWGLRSGCLVAAEASRDAGVECDFIFWQPALAGKSVLQQFLRLKLAGDMLGGGAKGMMEELRLRLASGQSVEVAGYTMSPELAIGLEQASLEPPKRALRLEWLELCGRASASFSPAATRTLALWYQSGRSVRSRMVEGPSFWQTSEIEVAPTLVAATCDALLDPVSA